MKRRVINTARALALITVGLFFTACPIIYVSHHDSFPAEKFEAALDRITALQADNPDRTGEACELNILVYDGDGGELVRISMPLAIVEWGVDVAQTSVELDEDADWEDEMNPLRHRHRSGAHRPAPHDTGGPAETGAWLAGPGG